MSERNPTRGRGPRSIVVAMMTLVAMLTAPLCAPLCAAKTCSAAVAPSDPCHENMVKADGGSADRLSAARACGSRELPAIISNTEVRLAFSSEAQGHGPFPALGTHAENAQAFLRMPELRWRPGPLSSRASCSLLLTAILRI